MNSLLSDIKLAFRALARRPSFTIISILTLAVAIGANTAIFSVVYNVLIRPLPFPHADRIVTISLGTGNKAGLDELPFSDRGYWFYKSQMHRLKAFGGYGSAKLPLVGKDQPPMQINAGTMTRDAFDVLGVQPVKGRLFSP